MEEKKSPLECPLCYGYFNNVIETPCCHTLYCRDCLAGWQKTYNYCPGCKGQLNVDECVPNIPVQRVVDSIPMDCPYRDNGCSTRPEKSDLKRHSEICPFREGQKTHIGKEGWLWLKANEFSSTTKHYWFWLHSKDASLYYYQNQEKRYQGETLVENGGNALGKFDISSATSIEPSNNNEIQIVLKNGTYVFQLKTKEEMEEWLKSLIASKDYFDQRSSLFINVNQRDTATLQMLVSGLEDSQKAQKRTSHVDPQKMQIFVKLLTGKTITVEDMAPDHGVGILKQKISEIENIPADSLTLIHAGTRLEDDKTLAAFGIKDLTTLICVVKPGSKKAQPSTTAVDTGLYNLAFSAYSMGDYREALRLVERALDMRVSQKGRNSPEAAECINLMALIFKKDAQYGKALSLYEEALATVKTIHGDNSPKVAEYLSNIGDVQRKLEKYKEATETYSLALYISEKYEGPQSKKTASVLNAVGLVAKKCSDYDKAIQAYSRAIEILGNNDPKWSEVAYNLADVYRKTGKYADAKTLYLQSLEVIERTFGPEHPEVAEVCNALGMLYKKEGLYYEALGHYQRALSIVLKTFGPAHPKNGIYLTNLGDIHRKLGDFGDAEDTYARALAILQLSLGPDHAEVAEVLNSMGLVLKKRADYDRAEPLYQRAVKIILDTFGEKHYKLGIYLNNLGDIERKRGNYTQSLSIYQRGLTAIEVTLGPKHSEAAEILHNMGLVQHQLGKYNEAISLFDRALEIVKIEFGEQHYKVGMFQNNAGMAYAMCNDFHEAHTRLKIAITILTAKLGKEHVEVADCLAYLGDVCMKLYVEAGIQDKLPEAHKYYQDANRIIHLSLGEEHPKCKQFASLLFICENFLRDKKTDDRLLDQVNVVLYDVSSSMKSKTQLHKKQPMTRGEISKAFFGTFVDKEIAFGYPHAIGLITFGKMVTCRLEITRNYEQFCKEIGSIPTNEGATACWDAINLAINKINEFKKQYHDKLDKTCKYRILCLSDGEDNQSTCTALNVLQELRRHGIIFDSIPIEGSHNDLRAITNGSGGFCFKVDSYESGLTLFEREGVLSLNERDISGYENLPPVNTVFSKLIQHFPYVVDPKIKLPHHLKDPASHHPIEVTKTMPEQTKRILTEFKAVCLDPPPQFKLYINEKDIFIWKLIYRGETGTPYEGKCWLLYITFPSLFPASPINFRFVTPIYHCNVNNDGKICHDILSTQWTPQTSIVEVLVKVAEMVRSPNPLNSLDSVKGTLFQDNKVDYYHTARQHAMKYGETEASLVKQYKLQ